MKLYEDDFGHRNKMAAMLIFGKTPLKIFSRTKRPTTLRLGMKHWGCGPCQVCTNDDSLLTLTNFAARSNLIPYSFIWVKS